MSSLFVFIRIPTFFFIFNSGTNIRSLFNLFHGKQKIYLHLQCLEIALETINNMQEEYNMTLRMNLDSLEAFEQHIFSDQDIEDLINRALDSLPTKCKEIFIMNKLEGKKQEQIATELNLSTNTVRNQISIAYKKLRNELKDYLPLWLFLFHCT